MARRLFGEVPGQPEGTHYPSRRALSRAGVHLPVRAGICGNAREGAASVVLSGGYEDDEDGGDVLVYTGQGGRDEASGQQVGNQTLVRGNEALERSRALGRPVRVVRGKGLRSTFAPQTGYRYDGLYYVCDSWKERGRAGYLVWRFRLEKLRTGG